MDKQLEIDVNNRRTLVTDLKSNFIVEASAGSGKTTMLVERMVALVESGADVSEIVAITFTKKAANEFYERFYSKLAKRSKPDYVKKEEEHTQLDAPSKQQKELDLKALKNIDTCFLGTIDAFAQKILLEHPIDAGISSSSKVLDDEALEVIILKIYEKLLKGFYGEELQVQASDFNSYYGIDTFKKCIKDYLSIPEDKFILPSIDYDKEYKTYSQIVIDFVDYLKGLLKTNRILSKQEGEKKALNKLITNFSKIDFSVNQTALTYYRFIKSTEDVRIDSGLTLPAFIAPFCEEKNGKGYSYLHLNQDLEKKFSVLASYCNLKFISKSCSIAREEFKKFGFLTFSESIRYFSELLRKDNGKEINVISNIRSKYKYFLIDEFQDTDLIESEIFYRINAKEKKNDWTLIEPIPGSMLMVGDPKQSIYHFRGADLSAYEKNCEIFQKLYGDKGILHLFANHRCNKELTGYFNNVFANVDLNGKPFPEIPEAGQGDTLYKNIQVYSAEKDLDPEQVTRIVMDLHEKGYAYKDIMITPAKKARITYYSKIFSKYNIPCFCEGSINFELSKLIKGVISLFQYKATGDLLYKVELMKSSFFNADLTKTLDIESKLVDELVADLFDQKLALPSEILENILSKFKVYITLNLTGLEILVAIINLLKDAEINGEIVCLNDAVNFLNHLAENDIERLTLLGNSIDAVRIANLHKVKGLESEIVILPFAVRKTGKPSKSYDVLTGELSILKLGNTETNISPALVEKEISYEEKELNRLLYVAATRAREMLIVDKSITSNYWDKLVNGYYKQCDIDDSFVFEDKPNYLSDEEENEAIKSRSIVEESIKDIEKATFTIKNGSSDKSTFYAPDSIADDTEDKALKGSLSFDKYDLPATTIGTAVHKLMEYISLSKEYELSGHICSRIEKDMEEPVGDLLYKVLKTIYSGGYEGNDPEIKDIYSLIKNNDCYPEVKFSYLEGKEIRYGSIDLVIESNDVTYIIDYKTDSHEQDHTAQLEAYKEAYLKFNPDKQVKTFIYKIKK